MYAVRAHCYACFAANAHHDRSYSRKVNGGPRRYRQDPNRVDAHGTGRHAPAIKCTSKSSTLLRMMAVWKEGRMCYKRATAQWEAPLETPWFHAWILARRACSRRPRKCVSHADLVSTITSMRRIADFAAMKVIRTWMGDSTPRQSMRDLGDAALLSPSSGTEEE